jgi:polyhydroxybutyrate depolymerase
MKAIHLCKIAASIVMALWLAVTQHAFLRKAHAEEPVRVESPAADYDFEIQDQGRTRLYRVHVPSQYDDARSYPVVLGFHGGGGDASGLMAMSRINEKADKEGFLAVYPEGIKPAVERKAWPGRTWNAGICCGRAMEEKVDDVGYVSALLDDLEKRFNVDKRRIFATGISNGAMMSYRLASELSFRIAAIAPVSGAMGTDDYDSERPVSIIHFHGTADDFAPFYGGKGQKSFTKTRHKPVLKCIKGWLAHNRCPRVAKVTYKKGDATCYTYGRCREGAEVTLCVIEKGGHVWPGGVGRSALYDSWLGKMSKDISATDMMWEFFKQHPKK